MEATGLVVGVASLFGTCMDVLEKVDSYRDLGVDKPAARGRFNADDLMLKRWGEALEMHGGRILPDCPSRPLADAEVQIRKIREDVPDNRMGTNSNRIPDPVPNSALKATSFYMDQQARGKTMVGIDEAREIMTRMIIEIFRDMHRGKSDSYNGDALE
ncbi:uncharacterized protein PpBr36_09940 [Pyricularia pennisetigena]|uniref:uncharacterized protein n=1 Tax=Pyricularia pennisetigena TaxID=1578925 RepID=UPI001151A8E1|nr:uncharacterized protein PpBr36_09940 [Pyricularia pennisetigena]TLS22349.1 hypothetical protein PpBr36_09940 [Pyricularia pennisetigena]